MATQNANRFFVENKVGFRGSTFQITVTILIQIFRYFFSAAAGKNASKISSYFFSAQKK